MIDGNMTAIERHLEEREGYDRMRELLEAEKERDDLADRIEELNRQLKQERKSAEKDDFAWQENYAALERKLAKALGQMQRVKDYRYDPNIGVEMNHLEETLAELKGEK